MDDAQLIECIRQYEVLFNPSHPKYTDVAYKNEIWNEVGEQMKTHVLACKTRWNNIRDTYRKSLRKDAVKPGQSGRKKYKLANKLTFINKYLAERKSNIEYPEEQDWEKMVKSDPEEIIPEDDSNSRCSPIPVQKCEVVEGPGKSKDQIYAKCSAPQSGSGIELMDYFINKNECQAYGPQPHPSHPVDAFLASIATTLKTFSPYYLNLAKSEIFATVQKYELKTITGENWPST